MTMSIPEYPEFAPVSLAMRDDLYPALNMLADGVSEFTFSGIYLFRDTYKYAVSHITGSTYVISGEKRGERFFFTPCCVPTNDTLASMFVDHSYLKNMSETQCRSERIKVGNATRGDRLLKRINCIADIGRAQHLRGGKRFLSFRFLGRNGHEPGGPLNVLGLGRSGREQN